MALAPELLHDLQDLTCTYRTATLADCETQTFVDSYRVDQLHGDGHVVAGHNHVYACGQVNITGHVHRTQIELGTIVVVERRVTATLFLLQDINLSLELGVV